MERERREESQERGEKRAQTGTDTDVESTQSRQKKGQMKSIFPSDSDEEAIVEFVKQHKELYDKTNDNFKDKQKKERLWEQVAATRNLPMPAKKWFETQHTRYGKLTQTKSGQAAEKSTERRTWLKDSFSFLRGHIRRKGVSKSSAFKSPQRPSAAAASASVPDTSRDTESEMESIASDVTHQPSSTSPKRRQPPVVTTTTFADPVLDQFQQMRSMISTFLGARQDPTPSPRQSFCNSLHSEIEDLEVRDFLTFRNDTAKLHSEIQYKAEERKRQVTTSQQVTTYQLPESSQATAGREYILTKPETQPVSIPIVQPTQATTREPVTVIAEVQQPSRPSSASAQPTSYVVVDDQQPGTSRQMIFTTFSYTFTTGGKSAQHFWIIQSLWSYSQCASVSADGHTSHFLPLNFNFNQHRHQCHLPLIMNSQDLPASIVRVSPNQRISPHKSHQNRPF